VRIHIFNQGSAALVNYVIAFVNISLHVEIRRRKKFIVSKEYIISRRDKIIHLLVIMLTSRGLCFPYQIWRRKGCGP